MASAAHQAHGPPFSTAEPQTMGLEPRTRGLGEPMDLGMRHLAIIVLIVAGCPALAAGQQSRTATLNATFGALARLSLSSGSLSFPDADPDTIPQVAANPPVVTITTKARATRNAVVTLTVKASGDLRSGLDTLPASNITWTATGAGFANGTLSAATPQLVGSWNGSGVRNGTQRFFFRNVWTHPTGTYTLTLLFTLSAP